jgi:ABC-2 type transport system permease protein
MPRWRVIWLVARREIIERGRSKGFLASLLLTIFFVVGSILLQAWLAGNESVIKIGYVGTPPAAFEASLDAIADRNDGSVQVTPYPDRAAAEAALKAEQVDGVYVPAGSPGQAGTLVFRKEPDNRIVGAVSEAVIGQQLIDSGVTIAPPATESLEPVNEEDSSRFILANIGVIFLFISIFSYGYWVLSGVVEEKQSRVVEVVLSTVRPRDLLVGKVLGIGILGLGQLIVLVATVLVANSVIGLIDLPATAVSSIVLLFVFFILGYALYSTLFGVLGALASRMEEAGNVTTPVSFLAVGSYLVSILVISNDPNGLAAIVASFFPFSAPMAVPLRAALDAISPLEIGVSIAILVVTIYGMFSFGARVYAGAVLNTAGRMRFRDALQSARGAVDR